MVSLSESGVSLLKDIIKKHGNNLRITVQKIGKPRTIPQNSMLHGMSQQLAFYTGHTVDEIKEIAKLRAFRRGYPAKHNIDGGMMICPWTGDPIPESSANVNTDQLGYLIDELQMMAAEIDCVIDYGGIGGQ